MKAQLFWVTSSKGLIMFNIKKRNFFSLVFEWSFLYFSSCQWLLASPHGPTVKNLVPSSLVSSSDTYTHDNNILPKFSYLKAKQTQLSLLLLCQMLQSSSLSSFKNPVQYVDVQLIPTASK